jgi:hypothetical protein
MLLLHVSDELKYTVTNVPVTSKSNILQVPFTFSKLLSRFHKADSEQ